MGCNLNINTHEETHACKAMIFLHQAAAVEWWWPRKVKGFRSLYVVGEDRLLGGAVGGSSSSSSLSSLGINLLCFVDERVEGVRWLSAGARGSIHSLSRKTSSCLSDFTSQLKNWLRDALLAGCNDTVTSRKVKLGREFGT